MRVVGTARSKSAPGRALRRKSKRASSRSPIRAAAAAGVETLAPAAVLELPRLDRVPATYTYEENGELLFELCAALVEEGLGTPQIWDSCAEDCVMFAQRSLLTAVGEERFEFFRNNGMFHLGIADVVEPYHSLDQAPLGNGHLLVTIEPEQCAYLEMGAVIEALEREDAGLGAAFFWTLTHALYRVMRIYDLDDAARHEEYIRECVDEEEAQAREFEFPEVMNALPACIRESMDGRAPEFRTSARRLLVAHRNGAYGRWIERVRRIERLARLRIPSDPGFDISEVYDSIPLPAVLVAFRPNDAIVACFDEESQYMLEGNAEPSLAIAFKPTDQEQRRHALRAVRRYLGVIEELIRLRLDIEKWEEDRAGASVDRQ